MAADAANPFDQFDSASTPVKPPVSAAPPATVANPFDAFDAGGSPSVAKPPAGSPIPTMTVTAPPPKIPPTPAAQTGDVPSQQPQPPGGDFYSGAYNVPPQYAPLLQAAAAKYGVPLNVLHWVGFHESGWAPNAIGQQTSTGTAKGMFQFMDGTAKELGIDPMDPAQAIDGAARYLRTLADRHGGDWTAAVESYGTFSTGQGSRRDAMAKAGFEKFYKGSGGGQSDKAMSDKYAGWDTPGGPDDEPDPEYVPFRDEPGTERGTFLPIARDKDGNYSLAVPDILRAPFRGMIEGGQEARGLRPVDDPRARGDIAAAAGTFLGGARPTAGNFTTEAQRAAAEASAAESAMQRHNAAVADQILGYGRTPEGKAAKILGKRANQDVQAGSYYKPEIHYDVPQEPQQVPGGMPPLALPTGPADEIVGNLTRMRESGKPANIVHAAGPNVGGETGKLARRPGVAQGIIREGMQETDAGAAARNQSDIDKYLTKGSSAYRLTDDLLKARSAESKPLYDRAYAGGSIAPLERQLTEEWNAASRTVKEAQQDLEVARSQETAARSKQPTSRGNDYSDSAANEGVRDASDRVRQAEERLMNAQQDADETRDMMRRAQQDRETNAPGAVWNPRIQRLLDRPKLKEGIRLGMSIQADEAAANGTRFNPLEYALSPEGEVIRVPNMRTLAVAKEGLDRMYSDTLDVFGRPSKAGVAIDMMRRSLLREMDAINPDYKIARNAWAGHSQSIDAIGWTKGLDKMTPEEVAQEFSDMTQGQQEFARLAVADMLKTKIGATSFGADEAKNLLKNPNMRDRLQPIFRTQQEFQKYVAAVADERRMYDVKTRDLGGSQTAGRQAEDHNEALTAASHMAHAGDRLIHGRVLSALGSGIRGAREWFRRPDAAVDEALARMMMDQQFTPQVVDGALDFTPIVPPIQTPRGMRWPQ